MEVSASPQTHRSKLEIPFAHCVRGGMTDRARGSREKRWAAEPPAPSGNGDTVPTVNLSDERLEKVKIFPKTVLEKRINFVLLPLEKRMNYD